MVAIVVFFVVIVVCGCGFAVVDGNDNICGGGHRWVVFVMVALPGCVGGVT